MVFSSITFLVYFLPLFIAVYYLLPRFLRNWWVLGASCFFYAWGAPDFFFILLGSSLLDFYLVRGINRSSNIKLRKRLLVVSLVKNIGLLLYFKYANFFIENFSLALEGLGLEGLSALEIVLPIGISFYTFQTITYAMDVYSNRHDPVKHPHELLLYILSFPQMIAGPIVQYNDIADQITERTESTDKFLFGFYRFTIGLGKKVLIANTLGELAGEYLVMENPGAVVAWTGILAYTFQIYFDFSGYSDMAIGLGKMIGFDFPENFDNPYTSRSITEFWRRWHITLGAWMRNYLYIPLGGNRVDSTFRLYANLCLVFLISGLWHGAAWNFVIWGAYHGVFLVLERMFLAKWLEKSGKIVSWIWTFFVVVIGWVFFSIEDSTQMWNYLASLFDFNTTKAVFLDKQAQIFLILAALFSFWNLTKFGKQIQDSAFSEKVKLPALFVRYGFSIVLFVVVLSALSGEGFNPFIYFRF